MKTVIEKAKTLKSVGYFPKDNFKGELAKQWSSKLKELEIDQVGFFTGKLSSNLCLTPYLSMLIFDVTIGLHIYSLRYGSNYLMVNVDESNLYSG